MKSSDDPVTLWIDQLRAADDSAAHNLWNHFVSRLYDAARKKLSLRTRSLYDEEDAAQSAFQSVCAGIAAGRFSDLRDRDSLLRLMLVITSRKISGRHRFDQRQRHWTWPMTYANFWISVIPIQALLPCCQARQPILGPI
jgi:DNA-directed RNA polymerase specialized sigma24 family protein